MRWKKTKEIKEYEEDIGQGKKRKKEKEAVTQKGWNDGKLRQRGGRWQRG